MIKRIGMLQGKLIPQVFVKEINKKFLKNEKYNLVSLELWSVGPDGVG